MAEQQQSSLRRFVRYLFSAPFRMLPAPFGDPVPSDLRVFEVRQDEAEHQMRVEPPAGAKLRLPHSKPARRREYLERQ